MKELLYEVSIANEHFAEKFLKLEEIALAKDQYVKYLQRQYHLTKGIQETFLSIVSHHETKPLIPCGDARYHCPLNKPISKIHKF